MRPTHIRQITNAVVPNWTSSSNLPSCDVRIYICVTDIRESYELCFSLVYRSIQQQRKARFLTDTVISISKLTGKSKVSAVLTAPKKVHPFFPCLVYITRKVSVFTNKSSKYLHITHTQNKETLDKFIAFTRSVTNQQTKWHMVDVRGQCGPGCVQ